MKFTCIAAFAAAASACIGACGGLAAAQPPVEAFASLPFISEPQLSADGTHFAALQSLDGKPAAVIYTVNAPAGTMPQVFASDDWPIASVSWLKNDRLMVVTKSAKTPTLMFRPDFFTFYRSLSVAVGSNDWVQLFNNSDEMLNNSSTAAIVDRVPDDPDTVYIPIFASTTINHGTDERLRLFRVDVHTGKAYVEQDGGNGTAQWIMDGAGHVVARVDVSDEPRLDHLLLYKNGSAREVRQFAAGVDQGSNVHGLTFDGKSLAYVARSAGGYDELRRFDLASEQPGEVLATDPHYDVYNILHDSWTGRVIGATYADDRMQFAYFDPARAALQRGIEAVFPGKTAYAVSVTRDGKKAIVVAEAPRLPPTYYFLDRDTHNATKIASAYPGLSQSDLGEMTPYPYKARDGLAIHAYLTLPPGKSGKNLPLVVMPHGGPGERDMIGFDWWAQFLANRGYAVFQPNYRGSSGYGYAFTQAGLHQWGLKMQDDITDGVKALIADGTADPKRICIVGASYGGYAALAGATFTPDLYACAASISGVSNLGRIMNRERMTHGRHSDTLAFWYSRIGDDSAQQDATSPALHADQVRVPVLLMHGVHDTTVPYNQSEMERDALEHAGKKVELVTFENDDHYLTLAETRQQMLTKLERFLAENIGH